jgi:hypothetical protein
MNMPEETTMPLHKKSLEEMLGHTEINRPTVSSSNDKTANDPVPSRSLPMDNVQLKDEALKRQKL